ncbi:hypothetical protein X824_gp254 [Escherichia phage 4MG]|uniref:Hyphothetical protein n=1 Tax=Escherichia phage 4MG TaxID=1391428 RepID=V5KSD5_9CAUD|nr:hypothetical protein X824_gp254 [Escherichia phage 4MG]AGZ17569.1 hyphothetical protein [Escherichia phage 4MG]
MIYIFYYQRVADSMERSMNEQKCAVKWLT